MTGMRIGGLASGMDTDAIVNKLMKAERIPLQKMQQDKTWLTWQRDAYRDVNKLFLNFRSQLTDLRLSSTFRSRTTTSTNSDYVTATATSSASLSSFSISQVDQLASAATRVNGGSVFKDSGSVDTSKSLAELKGEFSNDFTWESASQTETITTNDKTGDTIKLSDQQLENLDSLTIDGNAVDLNDGTYTVDLEKGTITKNDGDFAEGTKVEAEYTYNYVSFKVGAHTADGLKEETIKVKASESFNSLVNKVNRADVGVNMFYDSASGKMTLTRTETGEFNKGGNEISFSGSFITDQLQFANGTEEGGKDASFTINGLSTTRHSNNFEINGVTFQLKKTFDSSTTEPVKIGVNNDSEAVYENIKEFVDQYNELIGKINDKLQEKNYRDFKPLTDEQRKDMSEHEQKIWDEKAQSGLLTRDTTLSGVLSKMRTDFYSPVSGEDSVSQQLASIGISTTSNYLDGGKLVINESKLKKAIEADPESVENLFNSKGSDYGEKGIFNRLYDTVSDTMDTINNKAGKATYTDTMYSMGRSLKNMNDRISSFQDRLEKVETRYWRQFSAMESAIEKMNSQSSYLFQQFSGS